MRASFRPAARRRLLRLLDCVGRPSTNTCSRGICVKEGLARPLLQAWPLKWDDPGRVARKRDAGLRNCPPSAARQAAEGHSRSCTTPLRPAGCHHRCRCGGPFEKSYEGPVTVKPGTRRSYAAAVLSPPTAAQSFARARSAATPESPFATSTPSTMSDITAAHGRPRTTTAIVAPPSERRRTDRSTPRSRGGLRNPGIRNPFRRASRPSARTASAKRTTGDSTRT